MIRFFRSIRKELRDGGKRPRYAAYAFGEILPVMAGIVPALHLPGQAPVRRTRPFPVNRQFSLNNFGVLCILHGHLS